MEEKPGREPEGQESHHRSDHAVRMSVYVIRAFVRLREELVANSAILKRLAEIDTSLFQHDAALRDIYAERKVEKAREQFGLWCQWVKNQAAKKGQELLQPMVKVAEMIESHLEGILGHWKDGLTTAFMEGFNNKTG